MVEIVVFKSSLGQAKILSRALWSSSWPRFSFFDPHISCKNRIDRIKNLELLVESFVSFVSFFGCKSFELLRSHSVTS